MLGIPSLEKFLCFLVPDLVSKFLAFKSFLDKKFKALPKFNCMFIDRYRSHVEDFNNVLDGSSGFFGAPSFPCFEDCIFQNCAIYEHYIFRNVLGFLLDCLKDS